MLMPFILLTLFTTSFTNYEKYLLTEEIVRSLDDWERALLRDFVRGKGHGSVSRIPVELFNEHTTDLENAQEDNFVELMNPPESAIRAGPMLTLPREALRMTSVSTSTNKKSDTPRTSIRNSKEERRVSSVIMPASKIKRKPVAMTNTSRKRNKSSLDEPTQQTFKELSNLLQAFINRRKPLLQKVNISTASTPSSTPPPPPLPHSLLSLTQSRILTQDENVDEISLKTPVMDQWEPMDPSDERGSDEGNDRVNIDESHEDWESRMRELSGQLSNILIQIKKARENRSMKHMMTTEKPKPKLTILRNGSANQTNDGYYNFVASITLVEDNGMNILVDSGLGTDINGRMELLKALQKQNIAPPNIDIVVTTHGHPDHAGGVHDFPDAIHYQGWYIHHHTIFNLSSLFESNQHSLTDNVYLVKSAGHSSDDIAVVIIDEENMGKVVIAGDTFIRREDLDYPMMWQPLSANETEQAISRRTIICQANWIVPGHGAPFQVTKKMRTQFFC
ncbi:hypothetical protein Angca_010065 [Angiostrongylus cantonensis]|nr:hypothetical protein Angca_010065 [Angiostrongylus cantonensis]